VVGENQKQIRVVVFIFVFTLSVALMSAAPVRGWVDIILSPLENLLTISADDSVNDPELLAENETLIARITELEQEARATKESAILAEVISFSADPYERRVILNKGSLSGIKKGQAVLASNSFIGIVSDTQERRAVVQLLNDPQFKAIAKTKAGTEGLLFGQFGAITMTRIPKDAAISVGDSIFTVGEAGTVRSGLFVGKVRELQPDSRLLQTAFIEPVVSLNDIRAVSVLKDN